LVVGDAGADVVVGATDDEVVGGIPVVDDVSGTFAAGSSLSPSEQAPATTATSRRPPSQRPRMESSLPTPLGLVAHLRPGAKANRPNLDP
jgi:hypothetical protein